MPAAPHLPIAALLLATALGLRKLPGDPPSASPADAGTRVMQLMDALEGSSAARKKDEAANRLKFESWRQMYEWLARDEAHKVQEEKLKGNVLEELQSALQEGDVASIGASHLGFLWEEYPWDMLGLFKARLPNLWRAKWQRIQAALSGGPPAAQEERPESVAEDIEAFEAYHHEVRELEGDLQDLKDMLELSDISRSRAKAYDRKARLLEVAREAKAAERLAGKRSQALNARRMVQLEKEFKTVKGVFETLISKVTLPHAPKEIKEPMVNDWYGEGLYAVNTTAPPEDPRWVREKEIFQRAKDLQPVFDEIGESLMKLQSLLWGEAHEDEVLKLARDVEMMLSALRRMLQTTWSAVPVHEDQDEVVAFGAALKEFDAYKHKMAGITALLTPMLTIHTTVERVRKLASYLGAELPDGADVTEYAKRAVALPDVLAKFNQADGFNGATSVLRRGLTDVRSDFCKGHVGTGARTTWQSCLCGSVKVNREEFILMPSFMSATLGSCENCPRTGPKDFSTKVGGLDKKSFQRQTSSDLCCTVQSATGCLQLVQGAETIGASPFDFGSEADPGHKESIERLQKVQNVQEKWLPKMQHLQAELVALEEQQQKERDRVRTAITGGLQKFSREVRELHAPAP